MGITRSCNDSSVFLYLLPLHVVVFRKRRKIESLLQFFNRTWYFYGPSNRCKFFKLEFLCSCAQFWQDFNRHNSLCGLSEITEHVVFVTQICNWCIRWNISLKVNSCKSYYPASHVWVFLLLFRQSLFKDANADSEFDVFSYLFIIQFVVIFL